MTTRTREDAIRRVLAIQELAKRPGTPGEGAAALHKAQLLIETWNLTEADLNPDPWAGIKVTYGTQTDGAAWANWARDDRAERAERARRREENARQRTWSADAQGVIFSENNYYMPGKRDLLVEWAARMNVTVRFAPQGPKTQRADLYTNPAIARRIVDAYDSSLATAESWMPKDVKRVKSSHTAYLRGWAAGLRSSRTGKPCPTGEGAAFELGHARALKVYGSE